MLLSTTNSKIVHYNNVGLRILFLKETFGEKNSYRAASIREVWNRFCRERTIHVYCFTGDAMHAGLAQAFALFNKLCQWATNICQCEWVFIWENKPCMTETEGVRRWLNCAGKLVMRAISDYFWWTRPNAYGKVSCVNVKPVVYTLQFQHHILY